MKHDDYTVVAYSRGACRLCATIAERDALGAALDYVREELRDTRAELKEANEELRAAQAQDRGPQARP